MYATFQYFLRAYCTLSTYEEEMTNLMHQFKEEEEKDVQEKLLQELVHMQTTAGWKKISEEARQYGNRTWTIEETKEHIDNFVSILRKKA